MLLVSDLQRQIDDFYSLGPADEDEEMLVGENKLLRELLVKLAERAKEDQKMLSFLRQAAASGGRAQEYELEYNKIFAKEQVPRGTDRTSCQIAIANRFVLQYQHGVLEKMERIG